MGEVEEGATDAPSQAGKPWIVAEAGLIVFDTEQASQTHPPCCQVEKACRQN